VSATIMNVELEYGRENDFLNITANGSHGLEVRFRVTANRAKSYTIGRTVEVSIALNDKQS